MCSVKDTDKSVFYYFISSDYGFEIYFLIYSLDIGSRVLPRSQNDERPLQ
jgi:hypothetical protein